MSFVWKKTHTVVAAVLGVVLVGGGVAVATVGGDDSATPPPAAASQPVSSTPSLTPTPSDTATTPAAAVDALTGGKVDDGAVIAVKVENIGLARPQVGLYAADIVFAEQVEGAQTRLIAVYHSRFPKRLGPVRSARSTDVQLLPLFGKPGLVYSGANPRVQAKIDKASIVPIYRETRDHRRVAPHNVFVDLASLARSQGAKVGKARSIGWTFAASSPQAGAARQANRVTSKVGHDTFRFDYAASGSAKGRYTVRWDGKTYADGDSGTVTRCDNAVVMHVADHADGNRDVLGAASVQSDTVGSGKVSVYRDGRRIDGTWKRTKASAPLSFTDGQGKAIPLKPGQTWVTLQG